MDGGHHFFRIEPPQPKIFYVKTRRIQYQDSGAHYSPSRLSFVPAAKVSAHDDNISWQRTAMATQSADEREDEEEREEEEAPPPWNKSGARDYLFDLTMDPSFPGKDDIKPKQVWETYCMDRPEFKHFQDYSQFASRLRSARQRAATKIGRATEDAEYLKHDRAIFPERTEDTRGEPVWQGSKAQELLRAYLKDDNRKKMKPRVLHAEEDEYLEFSLDNFRNRIYSEQKAQKRIFYMKKKRAEKERKEKEKKR